MIYDLLERTLGLVRVCCWGQRGRGRTGPGLGLRVLSAPGGAASSSIVQQNGRLLESSEGGSAGGWMIRWAKEEWK